MSERRTKTEKPGMNIPIRMPAELMTKIEEAATQVKLSRQDTMRLAIERGLDVLIAQLTTSPQPHVASA